MGKEPTAPVRPPLKDEQSPGTQGSHLLLMVVEWVKAWRLKRVSEPQRGLAVVPAALAASGVAAWLLAAHAEPLPARSESATRVANQACCTAPRPSEADAAPAANPAAATIPSVIGHIPGIATCAALKYSFAQIQPIITEAT